MKKARISIAYYSWSFTSLFIKPKEALIGHFGALYQESDSGNSGGISCYSAHSRTAALLIRAKEGKYFY
jgi:hypothetical protein